MALSKEQQKELAGLARAANRRLERATPGQRAYLDIYISKYHVRKRDSGMRVFMQGKAKSESEYRARMRELQAFMEAPTSTRKGWKSLKQAQVAEAAKTLREGKWNEKAQKWEGGGYTVTDEELKTILEEIGEGHKSVELYAALANVEIAKRKQGEEWKSTQQAVKDAMDARVTAQERTKLLIDIRKKRSAGDFLPIS